MIIRREVDRFLREHDVNVIPVMQFDNIQSIKEAVGSGHGISILPERSIASDAEQGRVVSVPLDAPGFVRPVGSHSSAAEETESRDAGVPRSAADSVGQT